MQKKVNRTVNWLKQLLIWVRKGKYYILSIVSVIITVLYLIEFLTFYTNIIAIALSLTGLFIILTQQIIDAKLFADHKPNTFFNWIKSYPKASNISISIGSTNLAITASMKAHASVSISESTTLEKKVEFVLRQIKEIDNAIAKLDDKVDELNSSIQKTQRDNEKTFSEYSNSLKSIIAGHVVGAYDLNIFGITITICGTLIQFFSS